MKPIGAYVTSALVVSAATGAQMVTPGFVQRCLGKCAEEGLGAFAVGCASFLQQQRQENPLGMTVAHGIATKTCADLLAQTIPKQDAATVWIDELRLFRSMLASLLSTSLPFYWWTRAMHPGFASFARVLRSKELPEGLLNALTTGLGASTLKTIVTQALFRPANVLLFLVLQSVFRGDTARELASIVHMRFRKSLVGGILFYSISNLLMYSVPVPFLHPIMGSIAGLIFNVWLAIQAYKK